MYTVCLPNPDYIRKTIGGAEVQLFLIGRELARRGWRVIYASESIENCSVDEGIELVPLSAQRSHRRRIAELVEVMRRYDVDVCYQRGRKIYTWYAFAAAREVGIPFVNAFSMDLDCQRYKFLFRNIGSLSRTVKHLIRLPKILYVDIRTLYAIRHANRVFFQSKYQEEQAAKQRICGDIVPTVHVVPKKPVDKRTDRQPVILWLATIKEWKRPELFIRLANELANTDLRFVMAGNVRSSEYGKLIDKLQQDSPQFEYLPCNSLERSNELIEMADIFVNTSTQAEGFPNTFVQAWLRGTVVVSLEFDPDNLLTNDRLGRRSGSFATLKRDIVKLAEDGELRRTIAARAYDYAANRFDIDKNVSCIEKSLVELIESGKRR